MSQRREGSADFAQSFPSRKQALIAAVCQSPAELEYVSWVGRIMIIYELPLPDAADARDQSGRAALPG
ncbi:MAG: hypothetical protein J5I81_03935 [Nitrococcus mobilis]|nr:hypothetical protein [Nitrococcus mobilis]